MQHPERCHLYIECRGGQSFIQRCAPSLHFDRKKGVCDDENYTACQTGLTLFLNNYLGWVVTRACFKENSSLHISIAKAELQFPIFERPFLQEISIDPAKFPKDLFLSLHKQPFVTAHFNSS